MKALILALILLYFIQARQRRPSLGEFSLSISEFKPITQSVSKKLPNGKLIGDCFPACVASILGLDLKQVPFFSLDSQTSQINDANSWLRQFNLKLIIVRADHPTPQNQLYIIKGLSPRWKGKYHTVVGYNGKMLHDPHKDRTGIVGDPTHYIYFTRL
jgi:hypothetical protein